jgi:alkylation response protein AidB-like acyl-CoA dehydrogenase
MEFTFSPEAESFRAEVRSFLSTHLPTEWAGIGALDEAAGEEFLAWWRRTLYENRMIAVAWPVEYGGRGLSAVEHVVVAQEFTRAKVPTGLLSDDFGIRLLGDALLRWGTPAQKAHFLPRILSGEYVFCQGFSEPNAGSDLASLSTRAVLDGGQWVINGQKIWTTVAHQANWIFVLVRTSTPESRHRGISLLLCDMRQPGVEVRPLAMMSGMHDYNEVFFTDALTPEENLVGQVNGGWRVAMSLLSTERGEAATTDPEFYRAEFDRLLELARERRVVDDDVLKQRLAWCYTRVEIMGYLGLRTLTSLIENGEPGRASSLSKLYTSRYHQSLTELATDILGSDVLTPTGVWPHHAIGPDIAGSKTSSRSWVSTHLNARAGTIYGGSAQIQRDIIGETLMGLPRGSR